MQDFINSAVAKLGIEESTAKSATGTVLGFLKDGMGDQFSNITDKLPGAEQLVGATSQPAEAKAGGGGLFGSITGAASSMLGGSAGNGLELMGALKNTGLSADKSSSFLTMLINFIKEKAGAGVISQITDKFPMLKQFIG